jgi:hypothetical protein
MKNHKSHKNTNEICCFSSKSYSTKTGDQEKMQKKRITKLFKFQIFLLVHKRLLKS